MVSKYENVSTHIEDIELLKIAHKRNYCADNQIMTSFSINAGGRTILIGVDVNPNMLKDGSLYCSGSDGKALYTVGWATDSTKEALIESAREQITQVLNHILTDLGL